MLLGSLLALVAVACGGGNGAADEPTTTTPGSPTRLSADGTAPLPAGELRLGYFPNVTHAQPLIGIASGVFAETLGDSITLEAKPFNAGPAAIEALFAGELDAAYIGPNPAINGFVQSDGEALRIVAGSASGGARFIVRPESGIRTVADLKGKTIATPQLGNTQDVALRAYLLANELDSTENGGSVRVQPTANADTLTMFRSGQVDGAWVPEPWASRLEIEAGGVEFLDERELWPGGEFVTTHLIVRTEYLEQRPDVIARLLAAHIEVTQAIEADPEAAKSQVNAEIARLTTAALPAAVIDSAWTHLTFTWDPVAASLVKSAKDAKSLGFIDDDDLDGIYALEILNEELKKASEPTVSDAP